MIILASTIILSIGDTGIIDKAEEAVYKQNVQTEKERLEIVRAEVLMGNGGKITVEKYVETLMEKGITTSSKVTTSEDGTKTVVTDMGHAVVVEPQGTNSINITVVGKEGELPPSTAITYKITWENGKAIVTVNKPAIADDNTKLEYSIDNGVSYQETTGELTGIESGTTVLVRLNNGNETSEPKKIVVSDAIKPQVSATVGTRTATTIEVSVIATENETGIKEYRYYIKKNSDTTYELVKTEIIGTTYTYEGLAADEIYDIKIEVEDIAGNVGEKVITQAATTGEAPSIYTVSITEQKTNSFKVTVALNKGKNVTYSYYYRVKGATNYTAFKEETTETTQTITGLEADKTYEIQVVATNTIGTDTKTIEGDTIQVPTAVGNISHTNTIWSNNKATITVTKASTVESTLSMEYSINGGTSYTPTTGSITNIADNTTVLVRLTDGKNAGVPIEITVKDMSEPDVEVRIGTTTETTIDVSVTATDAETGIKEYRYYIKKASDTTYDLKETLTTGTYTYTNLDPETSYDVKVEVEDNSQNTGEGTSTNVSTAKAAPVISTVSITEEKTNSLKVTVALSKGTDVTYKYSYRVKGTTNYTTFTENVTENTQTITGLEADKTYEVQVKVTNTIGTDTKTAEGKTIAVTTAIGNISHTNTTWSNNSATITVEKAANVDSILTMEYSIDAGISYTPTTGNITNIADNTTVLVRLTDGKNAGEPIEITVEDTIKPQVTVTSGTTTETTIDVTVTATDAETGIKEYRYYIKKASDTTYDLKATTQTSTYTYTNLDPETSYDVKVEVEDNSQNTGEGTITKVSTAKAAPIISTVSITEEKTNSLKVTVALSKGTDVTYKYSYRVKGTTDYTTFKEETTETTQTITGLEADKTYEVQVVATNTAGTDTKTAEGSTIVVTTAVGNISHTNTTWSNNKATITVIKASTVDSTLSMEYSINGGTSYTATTGTITNIADNTTVLVRLTDGKNAGEPIEITVEDTTKPQVTVSAGTPTETTIPVTVTATENETGIKEYRFYIKKASETNYTLKATTSTATYTYTNLDAETSYDVKVEVEDNSQNTGEKTTTATTAKEKPVISGVGIIETTTNSIKLEVTLSKGTDVTYSYYYRVQDSGTNYTLYNTTPTTETIYTLTGLTQATTYELQIIATNTAGEYIAYSTARTQEEAKTTTLGDLVTSGADYGKTVNYSANGVDDWKVFYKQTVNGEEYVYLIASEKIPNESIPTKLAETSANGGAGATINGQNIYWQNLGAAMTSTKTIQNREMWLANWSDYSYLNGRCISNFLYETYWTVFKNTEKYGDDVVGAIGTPTAEMFVASWNEKGTALNDTTTYIPLELTPNGTSGYYINGTTSVNISTTDNLYIWSTNSGTNVWLASPLTAAVAAGLSRAVPTGPSIPGVEEEPTDLLIMTTNYLGSMDGSSLLSRLCGLRPVVCVKASIPAYEGDTTDIALVEDKSTADIKVISIEWVDGKANITVEKAAGVDSTLKMEYSLDDGKTYTETTGTIAGVPSGTTVLVRLTDGTNHGDTISIEVVDSVAPQASIAAGEVTETTIPVTVTAVENETGIKEYRYYIKKASDANYTLKATTQTTTYTYEGLEAGTSYDVKVEVEDNANNTGSVTITNVATKEETVTSTLGSLVTSAADYGKTVNYSANGVDDWKVFYKQTVAGEEYVYLIASESLPKASIPTKIADTVANGGAGATISGNKIYWARGAAPTTAGTIQNRALWLANWSNYSTNENGRCVSYFLDETYWEEFKNTEQYGSNVIGAIGTPTAEMFVASWNEKGTALNDTTTYIPLTLTEKGTTGYYINGSYYVTISTTDNLYIWSTKSGTTVWLSSPSCSGTNCLMRAYYGGFVNNDYYCDPGYSVRPVVCLKSSIPAYEGNEGDKTDFVLAGN